MTSLILGTNLSKDYTSRLARMERLVKIISWMLVLPGIIDLVLTQRDKRRMRGARGLGMQMLRARRANQARKDEITLALRQRETTETPQGPPTATESPEQGWVAVQYGRSAR